MSSKVLALLGGSVALAWVLLTPGTGGTNTGDRSGTAETAKAVTRTLQKGGDKEKKDDKEVKSGAPVKTTEDGEEPSYMDWQNRFASVTEKTNGAYRFSGRVRGDRMQLVRGVYGNGSNGWVEEVPEVGTIIQPGASLLKLTYAKDALTAFRLATLAAEHTAKNRAIVSEFQDVRRGIADRAARGTSAEDKARARAGKDAAAHDQRAADALAKKAEMDSTPYEETSVAKKPVMVVETSVEPGDPFQSYVDVKTVRPFVIASSFDVFKLAAWIPRVDAEKLLEESVMRESLAKSTIDVQAKKLKLKPSKILVERGRVSYSNDQLARVWVFFENTDKKQVWFGNVADVTLVIP